VKYCKNTPQIFSSFQTDLLVHQIFLFTFHRNSWTLIFLAPAFVVNGLQSVIKEILVKNKFTFACVHADICSGKVGKHIQLGGRQMIVYLYDKI